MNSGQHGDHCGTFGAFMQKNSMFGNLSQLFASSGVQAGESIATLSNWCGHGSCQSVKKLFQLH